MNNPVVGVAGWKNSGKTTLVTRLVAELSGRGYRIATVKHAHHGRHRPRGERQLPASQRRRSEVAWSPARAGP